MMKKTFSVCTLALCLLACAAGATAQLGADGLPAAKAMPKFPLGPDGKPIFPKGPRPVAKIVPSVPIALAVEAVQAAVAACAPQHTGIAILDSAGLAKIYYIADGSSGDHAKMAFRKANTALAFAQPTSAVGKLAVGDQAAAARLAAGGDAFVGWAGGVPIRARGELIGAIGVSGAEPSEVDEACAVKAIQQIQERLETSRQPPA